MTQFEFYKSVLFVVELLVAEGMFVHSFYRKPKFILRCILGVLSCFAFAFLIPAIQDNAFYCSFMFLIIFCFTVVVAKLLFNVSFQTIVFACIAGYTTQHLSYELYNLILSIMGVSISSSFYGDSSFLDIFPNLFVFAVYLCVYVGSYSLCYFLFGKRLAAEGSADIKNSYILLFAIIILIIDIILNAFVVCYPINGATMYEYIITIYNILACVISLFLQFEVAIRRKIEADFEFMQQIWNKTKDQYAISKENIELMNMKFHDFKHQIHRLSTVGTIDKNVLSEIESYIKTYDSVTKTGNEAVDVILTEKSLLCNKNNISLTYIIDGQKMGFMLEEDIYNLFGNIIDNGMEAVIKLPEEKRIINIHAQMVNNMFVLRAQNYYAGTIKFENGMPKTTKKDKNFHGFGTKSIQYICEKYGGNCTFTANNGVFEVNIVMFAEEK